MEKEQKDFHRYMEERLIGKQIHSIRRLYDVLFLGIGESMTIQNDKRNLIITSEIGLHIQSTWRIVNKEKSEIWLASSDLYAPNSPVVMSRDFKWYVKNLFDEKSQKWLNRESPVYIKKFKTTKFGDLFLYLSNGDCLEIWVNASDATECWRLIKYKSGEIHCVSRGSGVTCE